MTDATTAATECYFCHSAVVLEGRLADDMQPDLVIPFKVDRDAALAQFKKWTAGKRFLPRGFYYEGQIEKLAGVYYPYWMADYRGHGSFEGEGLVVSSYDTPTEHITETKVYRVRRAGQMEFRNVMRSALGKADRTLGDGIHPYDLRGLRDFTLPVLSGFMAEARDVEENAVAGGIENELRGYAEPLLTSSARHYSSLTGSTTLQFTQKRYRYTLLPAWIMTYRTLSGKVYYFAMNGETGKVCGRLPVSWGKLLGAASLIFAGVCGVICLGGYFLW